METNVMHINSNKILNNYKMIKLDHAAASKECYTTTFRIKKIVLQKIKAAKNEI